MSSCTHTRSLFNTPTPIFDRYVLTNFAGRGSYGCVLVAEDRTSGETVVLKTECGVTRTRTEYQIYRNLGHIKGIPRCLAAYTYKGHGIIVLECLGHSLQTFLRSVGGVLPIIKVLEIGRKMVQTLAAVHEEGYVHRDVKPDNIMLPLDGNLRPYLVDFGHAKRYQETGTGKDRLSHTVGTLPFMSVNVHMGLPYGRRDDILSLVYTLIYLAHGMLPWYRYKDANECLKKKQSFRPSQLNSPLHSGIRSFSDYAQSLDLGAPLDYAYMQNQLM